MEIIHDKRDHAAALLKMVGALGAPSDMREQRLRKLVRNTHDTRAHETLEKKKAYYVL